MSFEKSACLAALLLSFPLVVTAEPVLADEIWDKNRVDVYGNKKASSSGTKDNPRVEITSDSARFSGSSYSRVTIGHIWLNTTMIGGKSSFSIVDYNKGIFTKGVTVTGTIHGGYVNAYMGRIFTNAEVLGNEIVLQDGFRFEGNSIYGGQVFNQAGSLTNVNVNENIVSIMDGCILSSSDIGIYGAHVEGYRQSGYISPLEASGNHVTVGNGVQYEYADNNTKTVRLYGGYIQSSEYAEKISQTIVVSENYLEVTNLQTVKADWKVGIAAGYIKSKMKDKNLYDDYDWSATALKNTGILKFGPSLTLDIGNSHLAAGYVESEGDADVSQNTLDVTGGVFINGKVQGGFASGSRKSQAFKNNLFLTDAEVHSEIYGGMAGCAEQDALSAEACANENTVTLNGGRYEGNVYGGYARAADTVAANGNNVSLKASQAGKPEFSETSVIYGGLACKGTEEVASTGNTLNFQDVKGMTAGNIRNFQILRYEYSELHAGDVILTLTGREKDSEGNVVSGIRTSIANAEVAVSAGSLYGAGGGEFKAGDKVVLLRNSNGLDADGVTKKATITARTGISLTYDVEIQADEEKGELVLVRPGSPDSKPAPSPTPVQPGTKAIAEGAAAGLALASESSNATMEFLRDFSVSTGTITPFVHTQASSMRHETGSSINMSTVSLLAGLGTGIETAAGKLSAGAFFEYGKGSYTTSNSFSGSADINGDGNSWYMGGGILAKMDFLQTGPGHFYLEGSAHMGTVHNEYDSNDLRDASGNVAKFDMDSPYYSLHGGAGYVWNMGCGHDLDIYGRYIWTRVQGTDDTLTTKDRFEYDDMDSSRVRFGVRYTYSGSERFKPYVGAAYEHEFAGSCESTAYGHPVAAPSLEGSSGMGELGIIMKPAESLPLSINLGVQGFVGQKQGISGSCNAVYEF